MKVSWAKFVNFEDRYFAFFSRAALDESGVDESEKKISQKILFKINKFLRIMKVKIMKY